MIANKKTKQKTVTLIDKRKQISEKLKVKDQSEIRVPNFRCLPV